MPVFVAYQTNGYDGRVQSQEQYDAALLGAFHAIATSRAHSRATLARWMNVARSTAGTYVDALIRRGRLEESGANDPSGGRPARTLEVANAAGVIAVVDVRPDVISAGVASPTLEMLATITLDSADAASGGALLSWIRERVRKLGRGPLLSAAASVPAPVLNPSGAVTPLTTRPPLWEGTYLVDALLEPLGVPYLIENDATLRARFEAEKRPTGLPLLYLHLSHGIGAGVIDQHGQAWRGSDGVAGNIAHVRLRSAPDGPCFCGLAGCAATATAMRSVLDDTGSAGLDALQQQVRERDPAAVQRVRRYAADVGELAAIAANLLNPRAIVLSGEMTALGDVLLSGVRASVYENCIPVVTRDLQVVQSEHSVAAMLGAAAAAGLTVANVTETR